MLWSFPIVTVDDCSDGKNIRTTAVVQENSG